MPTYSERPQYWWEKRGAVYLEERRTEEALDTETLPLYNLARQVKSVLEVGCGFGRLLRPLASFNNLEVIEGFDFSRSQLENAEKYLEGLDVTLEQFDLLDCNEFLEHREREFDLVFTHGVFTHIPPFQIKKALANFIKFASKYVVLMEFELREGSEVKEFERIKYNEIGSYMSAGETDTWAYDFETLLDNDMELEKWFVSRNFKNPPFGHTTFIYRKKSFYGVEEDMDEVM